MLNREEIQAKIAARVEKILDRLEESKIDADEIPGIVDEALDVLEVSLASAADGNLSLAEIRKIVVEGIELRDEIREARAD